MKKPFLLFGAYCALVTALSLLAIAFGGDPHRPHSMAWDYLALGLTISLSGVCALGISGGMRRVRELEDVDAPATKPLEDAMSPHVVLRTRATGAA